MTKESSNTRQQTKTVMEMDMSVQIDQVRIAGRNRQELGLLHSPKTHKYLHEKQSLQEVLRTGDYRFEVIRFFDPETLEERKYLILVDPSGRVLSNKDIDIMGIKKGTPIDTIMESPFFLQEISSLSYIESNSILRHLPAIEVIIALAMRMAAEDQANKDREKDFVDRIPKKYCEEEEKEGEKNG